MNEESQVRGCYNITFNYTNQETVSVLEKTQASEIIVTAVLLKHTTRRTVTRVSLGTMP